MVKQENKYSVKIGDTVLFTNAAKGISFQLSVTKMTESSIFTTSEYGNICRVSWNTFNNYFSACTYKIN